MIVIDGYMGKSRKLEEILKEKNCSEDNTLILDTMGIHSLVDYGICYRVKNVLDVVKFLDDYRYMDKPFGIEINKDKLKFIVLEVNSSRNMIETYKKYEKISGKEFIITIQCPASESQNEIRVYEY